MLAPADHGEGPEDTEPEEREDGPARHAGAAHEPPRETAEHGQVDDGVAGHVEPVAEA